MFLVGTIIGIQFMVASAEDKAKVKEALVPYVIGCAVIFGAFSIWKVAVIQGQKTLASNGGSTVMPTIRYEYWCLDCDRKLESGEYFYFMGIKECKLCSGNNIEKKNKYTVYRCEICGNEWIDNGLHNNVCDYCSPEESALDRTWMVEYWCLNCDRQLEEGLLGRGEYLLFNGKCRVCKEEITVTNDYYKYLCRKCGNEWVDEDGEVDKCDYCNNR